MTVDDYLAIAAQRRGDWCQSVSGRPFWPLDPRPEDFVLHDIAHSLAMTVRFNGHCVAYYSVAEHSVLASRLVPEEFACEALMHDAAEAYLVDLPRPVKKDIPAFKDIEASIEKALAERFGLRWPWPNEVKAVDDALLALEQETIMSKPPMPWAAMPAPAKARIECLDWVGAKRAFLDRALEVGLGI